MKVIAVAIALVAALALAVPAASAKEGDVIRRGSCSGSSDWKLKLSPENGRIEAEFEVDQNQTGDTWRVRIRHEDQVALRTRARTRGASGSFSVRTVVDDLAGRDRFRARARNLSTGEVCRGTATF
ncbi:MAG TPA: hypothetical protein VE669_03035 [Actinomycetota bacterium]|nr:hypothetical protein [Actinomycetota bacterium]